MDSVPQHVEKLSQQLNILKEYIELKFGSDFKEFEKHKLLHLIKTEAVVTEDAVTTDDHSPSPTNTTTGDERGTNLTSEREGNIVNAGVKVESLDHDDPPISTAPVQVKMEPPDFPHTTTPSRPRVSKNGKVESIRYGGPVTSHRNIPPAGLLPPFPRGTPSGYRRKRPVNPSDYALPPCDYCPLGWRSAVHYKVAHRDMCAFSVGPDGSEVLRGYRCPRANCDREGRLLGSIYAVGKHMNGDCTRTRNQQISYANHQYYKLEMSVHNGSKSNLNTFVSAAGRLLLPPFPTDISN
ncbi:uncharacterized protein LOC110859484 [Folsomia candida]|uniref:Uncharacterized protein n=1 Tax=Folsomia candida TaxID=158441 RepID=A0A226DB00_FOLCA|nr:uncharacterized protein LOC110859484 [Folsomia candida]OXA42379.1 hypothetical protein Fcan01_22827 [Folsomia candida]